MHADTTFSKKTKSLTAKRFNCRIYSKDGCTETLCLTTDTRWLIYIFNDFLAHIA